jgi:membrane protease YdiL (CAAX protease family)
VGPVIESVHHNRRWLGTEAAALFSSLLFAILLGRWVFSSFDPAFWLRMLGFSAMMFLIGVMLLRSNGRSALLGPLSTGRALTIGAVSALLFYGVAFSGFKLISLILPDAAQSASSVYAASDRVSPTLVALALFGIAFLEEFYWRGWATPASVRLFSRFKKTGSLLGLLLIASAYGLVHIFAGNALLVLIAFVAAFYWGALFLRFRSILVTIVSHFLWDYLVFQIAPFVPH